VVSALRTPINHLPGSRIATLTADISHTTSQDISAFVSTAQQAGFAPSTINTRLSTLGEFFGFLRVEGLMSHQRILRRCHWN